MSSSVSRAICLQHCGFLLGFGEIFIFFCLIVKWNPKSILFWWNFSVNSAYPSNGSINHLFSQWLSYCDLFKVLLEIKDDIYIYLSFIKNLNKLITWNFSIITAFFPYYCKKNYANFDKIFFDIYNIDLNVNVHNNLLIYLY